MYSDLSQKYAGLLDVEDVEELFKKLTESYGSLNLAARACGIARTSVYGWENANYVKSITKKKVLNACLKRDITETLNFITSRSKEKTADLLITYLSSMYQKAIEKSASKEVFQNLLSQFLKARDEHFGFIQDTLEDEVRTMLTTLSEKAIDFGVFIPLDSTDMIKPSYLLEIAPSIIKDVFVKRIDKIEVSRKYNISIEIPTIFERALEEILPKGITTAQQPATFEKHYTLLLDWEKAMIPRGRLMRLSEEGVNKVPPPIDETEKIIKEQAGVFTSLPGVKLTEESNQITVPQKTD